MKHLSVCTSATVMWLRAEHEKCGQCLIYSVTFSSSFFTFSSSDSYKFFSSNIKKLGQTTSSLEGHLEEQEWNAAHWRKLWGEHTYERCGFSTIAFLYPHWSEKSSSWPCLRETLGFIHSLLAKILLKVFDGDCLWTAVLTSFHRFSVKFKSELWLTFVFFFNHCVLLVIAMFEGKHFSEDFPQEFDSILPQPFFPSVLTIAQVPATEKHPHANSVICSPVTESIMFRIFWHYMHSFLACF